MNIYTIKILLNPNDVVRICIVFYHMFEKYWLSLMFPSLQKWLSQHVG